MSLTTTHTYPTIGILGGMGPEATVDLMQRIIRLTPATEDSDHIHCLVDNNPKVPSRIRALIDGDGEDPTEFLINMAQSLERSGADYLVIACNTAHHYLPAIKNNVSIPIISMIECVIDKLRDNPSKHQVVLLASPAIQQIQLFEQRFAEAGYQIVYPDNLQQQQIFDAIKAVKAGEPLQQHRQHLLSIIGSITDPESDSNNHDINNVVIACTELSVLLVGCELSNTVFTINDTAEELAKTIVKLCTHQKHKDQ